MYTIKQINPDGKIIENCAVPQKLQQTLNLIDELKSKDGVFVVPENFGGKTPNYYPKRIFDKTDLIDLYIHLWGHSFDEQHFWYKWKNIWYEHCLKDFDEFWEDYV